MEIYNVMGQRVRTYSKDKADTLFDMDLTGQPAGLYLIKVSNENQQTTLKLIVK